MRSSQSLDRLEARRHQEWFVTDLHGSIVASRSSDEATLTNSPVRFESPSSGLRRHGNNGAR